MVSINILMAAADPLLPVRVLAMFALAAVVLAFIYVARHLKQIERTISADNLEPANRGPRNNLVLMICAIPIVVISLLLFLIIKA